MKIVENNHHWCFICPATDDVVIIPKDGGWTYNGDAINPTFSPSINRTDGYPGDSHAQMRAGRVSKRNHFFVRDGKIQYLSDCTHKHADQTLEIPDFPVERRKYYEVNG